MGEGTWSFLFGTANAEPTQQFRHRSSLLDCFLLQLRHHGVVYVQRRLHVETNTRVTVIRQDQCPECSAPETISVHLGSVENNHTPPYGYQTN